MHTGSNIQYLIHAREIFLDEILLENNTWKYIEQIQQMQLLFILKRNDNNMSSQNTSVLLSRY